MKTGRNAALAAAVTTLLAITMVVGSMGVPHGTPASASGSHLGEKLALVNTTEGAEAGSAPTTAGDVEPFSIFWPPLPIGVLPGFMNNTTVTLGGLNPSTPTPIRLFTPINLTVTVTGPFANYVCLWYVNGLLYAANTTTSGVACPQPIFFGTTGTQTVTLVLWGGLTGPVIYMFDIPIWVNPSPYHPPPVQFPPVITPPAIANLPPSPPMDPLPDFP